jgi:hypothetical protein
MVAKAGRNRRDWRAAMSAPVNAMANKTGWGTNFSKMPPKTGNIIIPLSLALLNAK